MKLLLINLLLFSFDSSAAKVFVEDSEKNAISVHVNDIKLPYEKLKKSMKSGLTNTFYFYLLIGKGKTILVKQELLIRLHYDLWDEVYVLKFFQEGNQKTMIAKNQDKTMELLKNQKFYFEGKLLKPFEGKWATLDVALDPVAKEKQKKILKWLSQNRVNVHSGQQNFDTTNVKTNNGKAQQQRPTVNTATSESIQTRGLILSLLETEFRKRFISGKWFYSTGKMPLNKDVQK